MLNIETTNLIQRSTAIIALGLLAVQLYFNNSSKILNYFVYLFIFIQPILIILGRYIFNSDFDPFYMYTDVCAICGSKSEYMINFLRIAFYSISVALFAPYFKLPKYLEYFYFIGFYSLSLYLYNTGPIVKTNYFVLFFWVCQIVVLVSFSKMFPKFKKPMFMI